jgi:hypothetical protein
MYKVNNTLTSAYGNPMDMQDLKPKQGPVSILFYIGPLGSFIIL